MSHFLEEHMLTFNINIYLRDMWHFSENSTSTRRITYCSWPVSFLNPVSFSGNHPADPADHPHSSLHLRWRCGAPDTDPRQRAAPWLWRSWQTSACRLQRQCFLSTLTTDWCCTDEGRRLLPSSSFLYFGSEASVTFLCRPSVKQTAGMCFFFFLLSPQSLFVCQFQLLLIVFNNFKANR